MKIILIISLIFLDYSLDSGYFRDLTKDEINALRKLINKNDVDISTLILLSYDKQNKTKTFNPTSFALDEFRSKPKKYLLLSNDNGEYKYKNTKTGVIYTLTKDSIIAENGSVKMEGYLGGRKTSEAVIKVTQKGNPNRIYRYTTNTDYGGKVFSGKLQTA